MSVAGDCDDGDGLSEFEERLFLEVLANPPEQVEPEEQVEAEDEDGDLALDEELSSEDVDDDDENTRLDFLSLDGFIDLARFRGTGADNRDGDGGILPGVGGALVQGELMSGILKKTGDSIGESENPGDPIGEMSSVGSNPSKSQMVGCGEGDIDTAEVGEIWSMTRR